MNGSTSPIRSVNAQFLGAAAERVSRAEPTETATVNASIATAATAAPLHLPHDNPSFAERPGMSRNTDRSVAVSCKRGQYGLRMTEMRLYDIRVTVERIEGRSVCGLEVGDYFEVTESNRVRIPAGRHFCLYALQSVLPLIPAKQRRLPAEDWLEQDNLVCCPDPDERVVMRIERIGERTLVTGGPDLNEVGLGLQSNKRPEEYVDAREAGRGGRLRRRLGLPRPPLPARDLPAARDRGGDRAGAARAGCAQPLDAPSGRAGRAGRGPRPRVRRPRLSRPRRGSMARPAGARRTRAGGADAGGGRDRAAAACRRPLGLRGLALLARRGRGLQLRAGARAHAADDRHVETADGGTRRRGRGRGQDRRQREPGAGRADAASGSATTTWGSSSAPSRSWTRTATRRASGRGARSRCTWRSSASSTRRSRARRRSRA